MATAPFLSDPGAGFQELAEGETKEVIFGYTATDAGGAISLEAFGVITVTGANDKPDASVINLVGTDEVPSLTHEFEGDDVDSDDDKASLIYTIVDQPSEGVVVNNGDGTFTFTPGPGQRDLADDASTGTTFTYTATDSYGVTSDMATVFVTIFGINTAPVAADVAVAADEDAPVTAAFGATDKQDLPEDLVYTIVSGPDAGTVTINKDGTFTFDPGGGFQGLDAGETKDVTFTYTATDSQGVISNNAVVTITVTGLNDAPAAANVTAAAAEDGPEVIGLFDVNDVDGEDVPGSLVYEIVSQPAEGTVTDNGDGTFTFNPGADFQDLADGQTRLVSFGYRAKDPSGAASNIATGTITVTGTNDTPTTFNLSAKVTEGDVTPPIAFKGDDADSDDTPATLIYTIISQPSGGTVFVNWTVPSSSIREPISNPCSRVIARPYSSPIPPPIPMASCPLRRPSPSRSKAPMSCRSQTTARSRRPLFWRRPTNL
jgi:VCBS repeat-containing protein